MLLLHVAQPIRPGDLRQTVEDRYESVKTQVAEDGEPIVFGACLIGALEARIPLRGTASAVLRFLPQRQSIRHVASTNRGALLWFAFPDDPGHAYRVTARRRPNTERHFTLVDPRHDRQEIGHPDQLRAGLHFLHGMGPGYSGFFNAAGPSEPGSFHFQFFGVELPLWRQLEQGLITVGCRQASTAGSVVSGSLEGWPFRAAVFEAGDPDLLADAVWSRIEDDRRRRRGITDVLFTHGCDGILRAATVLRDRRAVRPPSFWPADRSAYGDFGGLELSGLVVAIKSGDLFQRFSADPELAGTNLSAALAETVL
jgi:hypothetical protein